MVFPYMISDILRDFTAVPAPEELEAAKARNNKRLKVVAWLAVASTAGAVGAGYWEVFLQDKHSPPKIEHTGNRAADLVRAYENLP
jgi:hypothetical protein